MNCLLLKILPGFPGGSDGKESLCNSGDQVQSLSWKDPVEKGMATYSCILSATPPKKLNLY